MVNALRGDDEKARKMALDQVPEIGLRERHLPGASFFCALIPNSDFRGLGWRARICDGRVWRTRICVEPIWRAQILRRRRGRAPRGPVGLPISPTDLAWANLTEANLAFADLRGARNLETAELVGADHLFAELEGTFLEINQPPPNVLPAPRPMRVTASRRSRFAAVWHSRSA